MHCNAIPQILLVKRFGAVAQENIREFQSFGTMDAENLHCVAAAARGSRLKIRFLIGQPVQKADKSVQSAAAALFKSYRKAAKLMQIRDVYKRQSFNSPAAEPILLAFNELEQTNSANPSYRCAGENLAGFISCNVTGIPRQASCQAASQPAKPAPITETVINP